MRASFQTSRRTSSSASVASITTWNGSTHRTACGDALGDRPGDPGGHVGRDQFDLFAALFAERVEEREHGLAVPAGRGPHQPAGVMVNDDGQVPLALAMARSRRSRSAAARRAGRPRAWPRAATRSRIVPTDRHATRINSATAVFDVFTASHAT